MPSVPVASDRALPPAARAAILEWWDASGRTFAFREHRDPYAVLVTETMAQQTQIARAAERAARFLERFPTFGALAAASPADVLREWRGLGYNRRALNLWRAAGEVVAHHGGRLPDDPASLERLPGIGPYTARAVTAIAFGRAVGAVDTNVRRVLGRVVGGAGGLGPAELQRVADRAVPDERPGDWTHAVMDVGATFCRPARPVCPSCPVAAWCEFAIAGGDAPASRRGPARGGDFRSTSHWLRGRVLDRLRDAEGDGWLTLDEPIGEHDRAAVARALLAMARDGLVEPDPADPTRVRLPIG